MILNQDTKRDKFESRCKRGIFVGYSETSKGYCVWIQKERKVEIARDIQFLHEDSSSSKINDREDPLLPEAIDSEEVEIHTKSSENNDNAEGYPVPDIEHEEDPIEQNVESDENGENQDELARGRGRPRILRTGLRGRPRKVFQPANQAEILEETKVITEIPVSDALQGPDANEWYDAIASDLKSLLKNDTWQLISMPKNEKIIGSRIVLRNKYHDDGTLERRKARILASRALHNALASISTTPSRR